MARAPATAAIRALRDAGVDPGIHPYRYAGGGAAGAAEALGLDLHAVVKTIVLVADGDPVLVLMHGDADVSTRAVGRALGAKRVDQAPVAVAERATGYRVGGISPFGTRRDLPVVCHATVLDLDRCYVNGGRRGLLVSLDPAVFGDVLAPLVADVAG